MLRDLSLDYFPNFFNIFTSRCVADLKENYYIDIGTQKRKEQNLYKIRKRKNVVQNTWHILTPQGLVGLGQTREGPDLFVVT